MANFLRTDERSRTLEVEVTRANLEHISAEIIDQGFACIDRVLERAGIREHSVGLCLATGGMVRMPRIRERLLERFGLDRAPEIPLVIVQFRLGRLSSRATLQASGLRNHWSSLRRTEIISN